MTAKLSASDLTLIRGERCLFTGVGFALDPGQLMLLEGANGSGKTSLMRGIVGMLDFEEGEVRWQGEPIRSHRQPFFDAMVWMGHRVGFKADLTVAENLRFEQSLRRSRTTDLDAVLERLEIGRLKSLPLRSLSAGQQRRVALARMLMADAELWLMDEPFTNLDREGRKLVETLVTEHLRRNGMCVMAAHQDVSIDAPIERVLLQ
ncbi:MAG: cytochrome c biogenesis heme-transporting ATPase CcmA [Woeseiaceae bacterium]|nr:cytochrome c biogenesis heme-transporting ATPase CcmA [Woeseiaceae bacterium]